MTDGSKIRVLVADDSAFARKVLREILSADPRIVVVGTATDGLETLERILELRPDVVTLDLVMPNLDGVGVLRALPPGGPRVLVVSISDADSDLGIQALEAGAIDVVQKPTALATDRLFELSEELCQKVVTAAASMARRSTPLPSPPFVTRATTNVRLVVIGTSTGGPQALSRLVPALPANTPVPIAIALHIPAGYTDALAKRLNDGSAVEVVEASEVGMMLVPGRVILARGGSHLAIRRRGALLAAEIDPSAPPSLHTPSVDHLFRTATQMAGSGVLGVVLTGMGDDGLAGARAIREMGGKVVVESESSCIVYGMPRAVQVAGLAHAQAPLHEMPALIASML